MSILIGDMRQQMGEDLCNVIDGVLDRNGHKSSYYITVAAKQDAVNKDIIRQQIVLTSTLPTKLFGTMAFYVDNVVGEIKRLWVLPLDLPHIGLVEQEGDVNEVIANSVSDISQEIAH